MIEIFGGHEDYPVQTPSVSILTEDAIACRKIANIRVEKDKITIEIDLRKANSLPPQPESEEVENDPPNGLM